MSEHTELPALRPLAVVLIGVVVLVIVAAWAA